MKWVSAWASVIGPSHSEEGLPCQDSSLIRTVPHSNWIIAAVSDGAGSSSHADIGSEKAVSLAVQKYYESLRLNNWISDSSTLNKDIWKEKSYVIFKEIRNELCQLAEEREIDIKSLACTLIVAISNGELILCAHIGDGRGAFCNEEGEWLSILTPYKGEEANQTVFLTSDLWLDDKENEYFETQFYQSAVSAFTIMSDGCERAAFEVLRRREGTIDQLYDPNRPFKPFFDNNINTLKVLNSRGANQEQINQLWSRFLKEGNDKLKLETDDKSLVLSIFTKEPDVEEGETIQ